MPPSQDPDPRTGLVHLDTDECWRRLEGEELGRLAVAVGRYPDIFPVNFAVKDRQLVVRTEAGTKLAAAVLNAKVAFEVDHVDRATRSGWSVVASGTAIEPVRLAEVMDLDDVELDLWVETPKSRLLVIEVETITGRELPGRPAGG